jgi:streptogramin lyase
MKQPHSIAFHPDGRLLVCDIGNHRIRRIDLKKGTIDTFAGGGDTPLNGPRAIDFDSDGSLFLVLREGNMVLRLSDGKFHEVATKLHGPKGISCARDGSVFIADTESHTIRQINRHGVITVVAGTGERGDGPVGDPLQCKLSRPHGIFAASDGTLYIGDSESHHVRVIHP